jgi:hypothetical protein
MYDGERRIPGRMVMHTTLPFPDPSSDGTAFDSFTASGLWPVLSTEYPLLNPVTCIDFATYVHEARHVVSLGK